LILFKIKKKHIDNQVQLICEFFHISWNSWYVLDKSKLRLVCISLIQSLISYRIDSWRYNYDTFILGVLILFKVNLKFFKIIFVITCHKHRNIISICKHKFSSIFKKNVNIPLCSCYKYFVYKSTLIPLLCYAKI